MEIKINLTLYILTFREIKLSSNRIREFPMELAVLPCLNVVDLSSNKVRPLQILFLDMLE